MLEALGRESLDELVEKAVPASIRSATPMALPPVRNERDTLTYLRRMADRNTIMNSMIGMGYYGTFLPGVIQRNVLENPGWYRSEPRRVGNECVRTWRSRWAPDP